VNRSVRGNSTEVSEALGATAQSIRGNLTEISGAIEQKYQVQLNRL
jgi:hypothetical protein